MLPVLLNHLTESTFPSPTCSSLLFSYIQTDNSTLHFFFFFWRGGGGGGGGGGGETQVGGGGERLRLGGGGERLKLGGGGGGEIPGPLPPPPSL